MIQLPANAPGKAVKDEPITQTWETWMELQALGFSLALFWPLWPFGE